MGKDLSKVKQTFLFCDGGSCRRAGSDIVSREARLHLRNNNLWEETHTIKTRCNGRCEDAPTCIVQEGNYWYKNLNGSKIVQIIDSHLTDEKPVDEFLLFSDGQNQVDSDNERGMFQIKPFERREDENLGPCLVTKGLSSDQYLYPLFHFLHKNSSSTIFEMVDGKQLYFENITEVDYSKEYELELKTPNESINLVIGSVPKDHKELQKLKIKNTYYFSQLNTGKVGVKFTNIKNELIGYLWLGFPEDKAWEYCTKIQLQNNVLSLENA